MDNNLTVENKPPANELVYRQFRNQIMFGEIPPGTSITLRGLAKQFNVSTTPAREALQRLAAEGAVIFSSTNRISTPQLNSDRMEELASLRSLIEPELAIRALPRVHISLIERLDRINRSIDEMIVKQSASGYIRTNLEFHRTLYLRAQSPATLTILESVWLQLGPTIGAMYKRTTPWQTSENHRKIISALHAKDEKSLHKATISDVTSGLRMLKN